MSLERAGRRAWEGRVWGLPLPSVSWKRSVSETQLQLTLTLGALLGAIFHMDKLFLVIFL